MTIQNIICDIDGVLMHDNVAVPGAAEFIKRILEKGMPLVMLTNYPSQTGQDLANRFATAGIDVPDSAFYTSAMATADFLRRQEGKKAYVVGEGALIHELYKAGFTITDVNPDFVIVGETRSFNWEMMHKAAFFVANGARFIATNPDTHGRGFYPACGALCAGIEKISGRKPFYVGKPSPWIIRSALNKMQAHSEQTVIVGDTDREAQAKWQEYKQYVSYEGALALLSGWTGIDFGQYQPDQVLKYLHTNAIQSAVEAFSTADPNRQWTVQALADWAGIGGFGPLVVGSAQTVADELQSWVEETDVDGFNLAYAVTHETFRDVVELLVPELQKRGVFKQEYREGTLREKLFGGGPRLAAPHPGASYRRDARTAASVEEKVT